MRLRSLRSDDVEKVIVADLNVDRLPPFLERFRGDPRLELVAVDARDHEAVLRLMQGVRV